ncbi:phytochrome, partial [Tribonema minus]
MLYTFDEDWNGEVLYEFKQVDDAVSYMGLHFPASDIPKVARDLYFQNKVRVIFDTKAPESEISGSKLNLKQCMLRGVAPMHKEYMANMGIRGSLSIAVGAQVLEGLLVFHSYDG